MSARTLPLEAFDEIYEAQKLSILQLVPEVGGTYYRTLPGEERETNLSVFTTWEMSLLECGENAADRVPFMNLLTVAAFMGSSSVGQKFIKIYYEKVFSGPSSLTSPFFTNDVLDPLKYQDLVVRLFNVSLVQSVDLTSSSIRFSLHPLIAEWLRLRIELSKRQQYAIEVIGILKSFVEEYKNKSTHIRKALLQDIQEAIVHLNQCRRNDRMYLSTGDSISDHLKDKAVKFAGFLADCGRLSEAEELLQQGQNNCLDPELSNQLSLELAHV